ncbi:MAG: FAD-dependent oxidoreductase [Clostridia bacterium]|nr:FAD-dependent oxidoreductase [Clostridia bacterium]
METYDFFAPNVKVIAKTQVLVVGSGPAGISAAVAAKRSGAETLIVEHHGCLGGALSVGMVQSYNFSTNKFPQVLTGIPKEIEERCRNYGASAPDYRGAGIFIESELYKCMLDAWFEEENVKILLYTTVCGVFVEQNTVKGVYCVNKSGIGIILADCVIDATGDGDVAVQAGAEYQMQEKNKLQPVTVVFGLSGVDVDLFEKHYKAHPVGDKDFGFQPVFRAARENNDFKLPKRGGAWKSLTPNGEIKSANLTVISEIDATDCWDVTKAEIECRKQILEIVRVFRKYGADIGLGNCSVRNIATQLGIRETRRIVGEYILTEQDVLEQRNFDDGVGRLLTCIDLYGNYQKSRYPKELETFSVPYRALVPKAVDGLLVAGRCISCDEISFGAVRLMVGCALTGQAAGTAAALSVKEGVAPRKLDINLLREKLSRDGVNL